MERSFVCVLPPSLWFQPTQSWDMLTLSSSSSSSSKPISSCRSRCPYYTTQHLFFSDRQLTDNVQKAYDTPTTFHYTIFSHFHWKSLKNPNAFSFPNQRFIFKDLSFFWYCEQSMQYPIQILSLNKALVAVSSNLKATGFQTHCQLLLSVNSFVLSLANEPTGMSRLRTLYSTRSIPTATMTAPSL